MKTTAAHRALAAVQPRSASTSRLIWPSTSALSPVSRRMCLDCARHVRVGGGAGSRQQDRAFSANAISRAGPAVQSVMPKNMSDIMSKNQDLRTRKSQMKDIKSHQVPSDLGLLPNAPLLPRLSATYTLLWQGKEGWRKFLSLVWHRTKLSVTGPPSVWAAARLNRKKDYVTGEYVKKIPLQLKDRGRIARELHQQLNSAISTGDLTTISQIACRGLEEKIKVRQMYRSQSKLPAQSWRLIKYRGLTLPSWTPFWLANLIPGKAVTVILDFAAPLPWGQNSYVRQTTVRIKSQQEVDRGDGSGPQRKDLTEYVVLQSMSLDGELQPWRFWGTVDPASLKDVDRVIRNYRNANLSAGGGGGADGSGGTVADKVSSTMGNFMM